MAWHIAVSNALRASGLFIEVKLSGGKVRAMLDETRFLDWHHDPDSRGYSYALIDLAAPYPGDKRLFGWDDFPHPGDLRLSQLASHPHHFQSRAPDGGWIFEPPNMRGDPATDVVEVLDYLRRFLASGG